MEASGGLNLEALLKTRRYLKRTLQKTIEQTRDITDAIDAQFRLDELVALFKDLQGNHERIISLVPDPEFDKVQDDYELIQETYRKTVVALKRYLGIRTVPKGSEPDNKLPPLDLPTFDGKSTEWLSFTNLFKSMVDNNRSLTPSQKLQYLKTAMTGEAATILKHLPVTDEAYGEAWTLLESRFQNKREIVNFHLRNLITTPKIDGTSIALRRLLDQDNECRHALRLLGVSAEDAVFNYLVWERLDKNTRTAWELACPTDDVPRHNDMVLFLEQRARALHDYPTDVTASPPVSEKPKGRETKCAACAGNHHSSTCEPFKKATALEREMMVQRAGVCFNCLKPNHRSTQCPSRGCGKCGKRHHTLLHKEASAIATHCQGKGSQIPNTLLATAELFVQDTQGNRYLVRALLDMGSSVSFVTHQLGTRLGLRQERASISWRGIGENCGGSAQSFLNIQAIARTRAPYAFSFKAFVTKNITGNLPSVDIPDTDRWKLATSLELADEQFYAARPVDLLLGADVLPQLMKEGIRRQGRGLPIAQETRLGWILYGSIPHEGSKIVNSCCAVQSLEHQVQRFWEVEEFAREAPLTQEEQLCEQQYRETTRRDKDGRYIVRLPYKSGATTQNIDNRTVAMKRLLALEKRFARDVAFKKEYEEVIGDFLSKGHLIPIQETATKIISYLPHHAVLKETSTTTRLRVVFDASAKTNCSKSLNDVLMNGARQQEDLFDILVRFRSHQIAVTADIEKMYRQIKLNPKDFDAHRILWRNKVTEPIREFALTTVTFGVKPAPFLATRTLKQLAMDEDETYPEAALHLKRDFYVDDLLTGGQTVAEVRTLCSELYKLLRTGGFDLRKWAASNDAVLEGIPQEKWADSKELKGNDDELLKTLGIFWNKKGDTFFFKLGTPVVKEPTKRSILAHICRIFDPLGWLSPVTITGKVLFQGIWKENKNWDDPVPVKTQHQWEEYVQHLVDISTISIPRRVTPPGTITTMLCGFADASENAYAAAVYLRATDTNGKTTTTLIAAKTRVAPLKPMTIPRLELNGALLLARLLHRIAMTLSIRFIHAWTDSSVVLAWIRSDAGKWKAYVAHRVAEIQELVSKEHWSHVPTEYNPADCATRGMTSEQLKTFDLWWSGPEFLSSSDFLSRQEVEPPKQTELQLELRPIQAQVAHINVVLPGIIERYSLLSKLLRITALLLRFRKRCARISTDQNYISLQELREAETKLIRGVQEECFQQELKAIKENGMPNKTSRIRNLAPFLDDSGILRVGGRLNRSKFSYNKKHPILLPREHHFTNLIIKYHHETNCHAEGTLLLASLRQRFWIPGGKRTVQKIVKQCLRCQRVKAKASSQMMGNLPADRITPNPPFSRSGVDYAGPITLKGMFGRKGVLKGYVAIFVCFSTKAIHLELVSSLTSQAFISALKRFVSRRGMCNVLYSDCGTNFVGADRELNRLLKATIKENPDVAARVGELGITWKFNPPGAPHFGGLWEAGVKSVKTHLNRVIGNVTLNFEDMTTTLYQIEACLNSRPLTELSSDPNDLEALTPGHFLIGRPLNAIPEPDLEDVPQNKLTRYQHIQKMTQEFWKRWATEYIVRLQNRPKWFQPKPNLGIDRLVLLMEHNLPPLMWQLGRIVETHPGPDGRVRVVSIKTATGIKKRPITQIAPLPYNQDK